ncbi:hypothetical protein BD289DRAFT_119656 [Coniella lustricola]|uniref:Uncharacterized protein n=1 Tax=Coniella lustricola TaxID=2025994 RepID=A0A2T3AG21_9PEZI|nr:hypothetical protein BD289DRAFT_119656 [Coniella lustricola]
MKIWDVANYFRVEKLLTAVQEARDTHMVLLSKHFSNRRNSPVHAHHNLDMAYQQLDAAIRQLYDRKGKHNMSAPVQAAFQPCLLSTYLCVPSNYMRSHPLPDGILDGSWAAYKEIIDAVRRDKYLIQGFVRRGYYKSRGACTVCQRLRVGGLHNYESPISGMLHESFVEWCEDCFRVPTWQDWLGVAEYKRMEQEKEALDNRLNQQRKTIAKSSGLEVAWLCES